VSLFKKKDPRHQFVAAVEKVLRRLGITDPIEYDEDLFALRLSGERTIMLGNLFARWQSLSKADANTYLDTAVAGLVAEADQPKSFADASERLFPGVRDRATIESTRWMAEMGGSTPVGIPNRPLGASVLATVVLDSPTTMMMVNDSFLDDWGVTFDEVFDAAVGNLDRATDHAAWGRVGSGTYVSMWNDDYDVSRILVKKVIDPLELKGDPVAFVPHRNRLIVTGDDDPIGLAVAMSRTEEELDQPSQVSAVPLVRRDGVWADLDLPAGHPASTGLDRLRAVDRSLAYGATTPLIQAVLGDDVFVANSILAEREGVITSAATWIDAPCIIPETDRVMFFRSQEENWLVGWDDVMTTVGHLMTPTDFYPRRYHIEGFPTADQLAAMPVIVD
jgi:uncharacterized protein YtpQ (UPF0354 family)